MSSKAIEELAKAIAGRALEIYEANGDDASERADAKDLVRALARILSGETFRAAFGSPGDWGYSTPVGKALAGVYRDFGRRSIPICLPSAVDLMAHKMAFASAESVIDSHSITEREGDLAWMNIEGSEDELIDELRYLEIRGALIHHPEHPNWIQIGEPNAA